MFKCENRPKEFGWPIHTIYYHETIKLGGFKISKSGGSFTR